MRLRVIERLFAALSCARGSRIFHPRGTVHAAQAVLFESFPAILAGPFEAEFRLSRAFGLPSQVGDFFGLAVRIYPEDGPPADLLFASSFTGALGKWVPQPHRQSSTRLTFSSLLPYETMTRPGRKLVLGATVRPPTGLTWETIIATHTPPVAISLWSASPLGRPRPCGYIVTTDRPPHEPPRSLRFNPWHAPPGLQPAGLINKLRDPAYRGSQQGRHA
jgi:hypothetical protein